MAIQQTKKQSDLEKRLKLLRQQVYGKETVSSIQYPVSRETENSSKDTHNTKYILPTAEGEAGYTDLTYLYQDLFKILALSSIAIGVQTILFFLLKNHILSLNLF